MNLQFPNPGETFEGNYLIEAILGSGGFARVYRGLEVGLERKVALKILRPPLSNGQSDSERDDYLETLMQRFRREALLLGKLRSPYTVTMYHYGKTEGGLLYMVLEYIDGLSLAEVLRDGKALPASRVRKILTQVLSSLHEAHLMGMLHRDLKPANIMVYDHLGQRDQVKLLDFGIAKVVTEASPENRKDLTSDGTLIGTPRYMAPEQIQAADAIGPASDIYALGLVAYEMITGERAIDGESSIQIIGRQLAPDSFRLPEDLEIPPRLRAIINRMIEKKLSARFSTAAEIIEELEAPDVLEDAPSIPLTELHPVALEEASEDDVELVDDASLEEWGLELVEEESFGVRRRRAVLIGIVSALLLVGFGAWALVGNAPEEGRDAHATDGRPLDDSEKGPEPAPDDAQALLAEAPVAEARVADPDPLPAPLPEAAPMVIEAPTLVVSNRAGVEIAIDGQVLGTTPEVVIPSELLPARVVARFNGVQQEHEVEPGEAELRVEFEPIAKAASAAAPSRPPRPPKPDPPRPKPDPPRPKPSNPYAPVE